MLQTKCLPTSTNEKLETDPLISASISENSKTIENSNSEHPISAVNFIHTKEYERFFEFCEACRRERYIGLCYGPAGVGKSISAWRFASWDKVIRDIEESISSGMHAPITNMATLNTIVYTPEVINSPRGAKGDVTDLISEFNHLKMRFLYPKKKYYEVPQKNYVKTIIVDEADRLQPKTLEYFRDLYDRKKISVIFIGMPGIEKRLTRFPQLYSRIGFVHHFRQLNTEEISFVITNHCKAFGISIEIKDLIDQEAIAAMTRITQGNFRLLNRLLKQALRIMEINKLSIINKEVIESSRLCLVIGNVY